MADTDIRCHRACVYSGCSVMCNNTSACDHITAWAVSCRCYYAM